MQEINDYLADHQNITKVTQRLWWCAGADITLLKQSPMSDRVKYAGIGGIVLCTGLLAGVSGAYAFYTIFSPKSDAINSDPTHLPTLALAFVFGIIWGLIIFNMDRFIVSSTGKGDGTDKISGKEFLQALPRIIIAIILGFAISAPLEIRILKTEIDAELQSVQDEKYQELNAKTDAIVNLQMANKKTDLNKVEHQITEIESVFEKQRLEIINGRKRLEDEIAGRIGSGKAGEGPAAKAQKENLNKQEEELNEKKAAKEPELSNLRERMKRITADIDVLDKSRDEKYKMNKKVADHLDGLMERIHISHDIGGAVPWLIFLVLLSIEAGPIFFKMMMSKGVYDYLVENNKRRFEAHHGIVISPDLVETKDGVLVAEKVDFLEVDSVIAAKKMQLAKENELKAKVITKWSADKDAQIDQSPKDFYTE